MWGPTKNVGPVGFPVLTFIGYKQTDKQSFYIEGKEVRDVNMKM